MVRCSPLSPEKRIKKGVSHVEAPAKLAHLENTQEGTARAMRSLHTEFGLKTSEAKLDYTESHRGS